MPCYTSALLSVEMEQWPAAQATINRIPVERRTAAMQELAEQISLTMEVNRAPSLVKRGQRQEALALLDRLQPWPTGTPSASRRWPPPTSMRVIGSRAGHDARVMAPTARLRPT